jgi:hypothetical protein
MKAVVDNSVNRDCVSLFEVSQETAELQASYEAWLEQYLETFGHHKYLGCQHQYLGNWDQSAPDHQISINCHWKAAPESGIGGFFRGLLAPMTIFPHHARAFSRRFRMASDAECIYHDWVMVGSDINEAMRRCSKLSSPDVRPDESNTTASEEWTSTVR